MSVSSYPASCCTSCASSTPPASLASSPERTYAMRLGDGLVNAARAGIVLVLGILCAAGCAQPLTGPYLCGDPPNPCTCEGAADRGAVVVRWRLSDAQAGQLLSRGECCCTSSDTAL